MRPHVDALRAGSTVLTLAASSSVAVLVLGFLALQIRSDSRIADESELRIYCAAGLAEPIEEIVREFNATNSARVSVARIGGSGELAGQIKMEFATNFTRGADLFVSADQSLIDRAKGDGTIESVLPLARQNPVIAVNRNNVVPVESLKDLVLSSDSNYGVASKNAAIGMLVRQFAESHDFLDELESNKSLETENVMTLAQALVTGSIEVAVLWDTTVNQVNRSVEFNSGTSTSQTGGTIQVIGPVDPSGSLQSVAAVAVLKNSRRAANKQSALELAKFLSSSQTSRAILKSYGYEGIVQPNE